MAVFKKITAAALAVILAVSLCSCAKSGEKMKEWLDEVSTAYEGYLSTPDAENAVSPSVSLLLGSSGYIMSVFEYMQNGTQPKNAEITEENGVYTYKAGYFKQIIEIDTKTPAVRVEMVKEFMDEGSTEFITVITEKGGEYFIQHHFVEFSEYYEIRFTEKGGSTTIKTNYNDLQYSIFEGDIPESFAKEN